MRRLLTAIVIALPLAACTNGGRPYPSLDRRPAEREYGSGSPVAGPKPVLSPVPMAPAADLVTRLSALRRQALAAHGTFQSRQASATRAVSAARGAAVGSESWSVAQVALADLESARSQAMIALADLDSLLVQAAVANADAETPDLPAVEKVRSEVTDLVGSEDEVLGSLYGRLRG